MQPYVFDWTKDRTADLVEAMGLEEFASGIIPFTSTIQKLNRNIRGLDEGLNSLAGKMQNLTSRLEILEQVLQEHQNSGSNGGENQGEDAALRNRVEALWAQFVGTDASNMTTEEMVAALENGANITPDPNATLAERIEALEALAAQQQ